VLSAKPWKLEAVVRLLLQILICWCAGSLLAGLLYSGGASGSNRWKFIVISLLACGFLGGALVMLRKRWTFPNLYLRAAIVLACFYTGLLLVAAALYLSGATTRSMSAGQMVVALLSLQGAGLVLLLLFLREQQFTWNEAFGLSNHVGRSVMIGVIAVCIFTPLGLVLRWISVEILSHIPHIPIKPDEQQAVQTIRETSARLQRLILVAGTILLAPVAEECFFRGILYPAIKQAGFPRLAFWLTSIAFAAIHQNLAAFIPLMVLAMLLVVLYERTNNLLAPISAHATFNAVQLVIMFILERKNTIPY
jgi:membrane protease YdiL (CAAX protease family)